MTTPAAPQRRWHAACPNCGAPVEFASAASASAVCGFCRSTLLREGDALRRIGQSAELFDDHSPLQLGATGRYLGAAFTVVGRQQLGDADARWSEWHLVFDTAPAGAGAPGEAPRSGWLSEDNGRYVVAFDAALDPPVPDPAELHAGEKRALAGAVWDVASVVQARVLAAAGELPAPPRLEGPPFTVVDLRNARGEVATLDWRDPQRVGWSVGRSVRLAELALRGLREDSARALAGRSIECPGCGAALDIKLEATQSIVCGQCRAVVDLSQGVGGELAHYAQDNAGAPPLIPLGRTGTLALGRGAPVVPWQVVGYAERIEVDVEAGEEQAAWREYLLYNRDEGFAFLVDAEDGWSFAIPLTGVPQVKGERVVHDGATYTKRYSYSGAVTYVLGEFYWRLKKGEKTRNTDYAAGDRRLNREQVGAEVTWSAGAALDANAVATAFGLGTTVAMAMQRDRTPLSGGGRNAVVWIVAAMVLTAVLMSSLQCSSDDCQPLRERFGEASAEYQQCRASQRSATGVRWGGGSSGGFSSGGGHK